MINSSKSMMSKLSVTLITLLVLAFICSAQASCWRYGHSCWGGHGKRSGGKAAMAVRNSELSPSGNDEELSKRQQIPLELQPLQQSLSSATFQGDEMMRGRNNIELSPQELYRSKFLSIFPYSSTNNDDSRDEIVEDKQQVDEEDEAAAAPADYTRSQEETEGRENDLTMDTARNNGHTAEADSSEIFIGIPRISSTDMKPLAIATSEDSMKRAVGDLSARKFPLENFNLYKLVRIVRRRK